MRKNITLGLLVLFLISGLGLTIYLNKQAVILNEFNDYVEAYKLGVEDFILADSKDEYDNLIQESNDVIENKETKSISELKTELENLKSKIISNNTELKALEEINSMDYPAKVISDKNNKVIENEGFVLLKDIDNSFIFDIRYATTNNFTHTVVYPTDMCILRTKTAYKLVTANEILKIQGYKIKIYDAYRSTSVQQIFWNLVQDNRYVANPATGGSIHNKGCAVDITLVDLNGNDIEMPSEFDEFSEKAFRSSMMNDNIRNNLNILTNAMISAGFQTLDSEWWHYEDIDQNDYSIIDIVN